MRTLAKPPKTKKIQKQTQKQSQKKPQSKKITKTIFSSPFTYKIQGISHEDMDQLRNDFLPYLKDLRKKMPIKQSNNAHKKFISFKNSQNQLPTLTSQQLILGVKSCIKAIKKEKQRPELIIIFYEQNRQQLLEELLCRILKQKISYIVARNDKNILDQLAVKTITCIGLKNQQISHKLSKLSTRCSIQIPWLVDKKWIGLKDQ